VTITIEPDELIPGRRASRARVIAAGLTDDDINRLIKQAQKEVEPAGWMRIVLDTNVLVSAALKQNPTSTTPQPHTADRRETPPGPKFSSRSAWISGQRISPSSIYVLSGTMKARPVGVGQSKWIIHDTARAMSCHSLPFGTSPSAPPLSGEHGGPMPIARVRKPASARVRAASYPAWPIVIEPGSGSFCASESIKLLLRAFRPSHNDEIAVSLRRKNFEGGPVLHDRHSKLLLLLSWAEPTPV
jgi:hypothetical protein